MLALYVDLPYCAIRKPYGRLELTCEEIPPPSTCYGFLLSLVGEKNVGKHSGVKVTAGVIESPKVNQMVRRLHRIKDGKQHPDHPSNTVIKRVEYLTGLKTYVFLDSSEEMEQGVSLEERVKSAIKDPKGVERSGILTLGDSESIVNDLKLVESPGKSNAFLKSDSIGVRMPLTSNAFGLYPLEFVNGEMVDIEGMPAPDRMPRLVYREP